MSYHDLQDVMRAYAAQAVAARQFKGTLVTTGYNPQTHAVKGILVPHGIETGWIPIAAVHAGNNYGIACGPKVGDAQALDGDQYDIEFDFGDPNTIVARHRQFSTPDSPPQVQSGEMVVMHESGNKIFFAQDKSMVIVGQSGSQTKIHTDGRISNKPAPGKFVYDGGDPDEGGTFAFVMTVSGPSTTHQSKIG